MPDDGQQFGSGLDMPTTPPSPANGGGGFGSMFGTRYTTPDPNTSPLDQTADLLKQRVERANQIGTNPFAQFFAPEQARAARDFVPAAVEKLQTIEKQKADIAAGRQQAETMGLAPGEVSDQATKEDRITVAQARALKGDLKAFQGLQAVEPKAAEAIQDQVHSAVAAHLTSAQAGFDKLANARNQSEYAAALKELRKGGSIAGLESLGLKVPEKFEQFGAVRGREAEALRNARIGVDTIRQKLEDRNTYQPMEEKEAKTYANRLTTVFGNLPMDNGTWSRNSAAGTRGAVFNGASNPSDLGKTFAVVKLETMKPIVEQFKEAMPKEDIEKFRNLDRIGTIATKDPNGTYIPPEGLVTKKGERIYLNTNPNVQMGLSEGFATALRGGHGGATGGLLNIETSKRGAVQALLDKIKAGYSGGLDTITGEQVRGYLTQLTQKQQRQVLDGLREYNDKSIADRVGPIAKAAGAAGYDRSLFGLGKSEGGDAIDAAIKEGRQAQIQRMTPFHQAIGGGDGVFQTGAQRPGAGATGVPAGTQPTTQLPGARPLQTPVQQAISPPAPTPSGATPPPTPPGGAPLAIPPGGSPSTGPGGTPSGGGGFLQPQGGAQPDSQPPVGGPMPGRGGLPPGIKLDNPAALDAAANRTIQIESGFKPGSKTGSYVGLGQWSKEELKRHGITNPDDIEQNRTALKTDMQVRAAKLQKDGLPATAANVYLMHQQGEAGLEAHLRNPGKLAWENVRFGYKNDATAKAAIWGNMTPDMRQQFTGKGGVNAVTSGDFTRLWEARYNNTDISGKNTGGRDERTDPDLASYGRKHPRFEPPGFLQRLMSGDVPGGRATTERAREVGTEYAPQIGGMAGMVAGGAAGGPLGAVAGGAAGGGAGQSLKDYLQNREQSAGRIAKEAALQGVLGVVPEGRPIVGAATRMLGAGGVEGGAEAIGGGDAGDVAAAAVRGTGSAVFGESFGRALGMGLHKIYKLFTPDAKQAVIDAAKKYADAADVMRTEEPKLLNAAGASSGPNPKYAAAEVAKTEAETKLKEMLPGAKPEEMAYAHRVTSEGVPKQEAIVSRPGDTEKRAVGAGYQQLEQELPPRKGMKAAAGRAEAVEGTPLKNGPIAAIQNGDVVKSADNIQLAQHVENAIRAPAKTWAEKWNHLKEARTDLLQAERDALTSTEAGRSIKAADMRVFADTIRTQQEKVAEYVFGKKDGAAFIDRLKVLDVRYRKLMDATNGGDIAKAVAMKGDAGREAEKRFIAFAAGDPEAQAAYRAMRGVKGDAFEATIPWTVAAEGIPVIGRGVKLVKMAGMLNEYATRKAAGDSVKFRDLVKLPHDENGRLVRDVAGNAGARAAVGATEDQGGQGASPFDRQITAGPFDPVHLSGTQPKDYLRELSRNPDILAKNIDQASNFNFAGMARYGKPYFRNRPGVNEAIKEGLEKRLSYSEIARQLGVSHGAVMHQADNLNVKSVHGRGRPFKEDVPDWFREEMKQ